MQTPVSSSELGGYARAPDWATCRRRTARAPFVVFDAAIDDDGGLVGTLALDDIARRMTIRLARQ